MNDFTKDELRNIATLFKFVEVGYPDYALDENLWVKIESMIDSYSDHECDHETDAVHNGIIAICEGDIHKPFKCKKCGEFYEEHQELFPWV